MVANLLDRELIPTTCEHMETPTVQAKVFQSASTCLWLLCFVHTGCFERWCLDVQKLGTPSTRTRSRPCA